MRNGTATAPPAASSSGDTKSAKLSFRDPGGRLVMVNGRLLRFVNAAGQADLSAFLATKTARRFYESGKLVPTRVLGLGEVEQLITCRDEMRGWALVLEHEPLPFASYPSEWPPEMLSAAGRLTLDLAEQLLSDDFGLKDATPFNVLFRGPHPVFVDLLSFEKRDPRDTVWLPYAQFARNFLLPLLAQMHFGLTIKGLLETGSDGVEPETIYRLCGPLQKFSPGFLPLVSLPTWLNSHRAVKDLSVYERRLAADEEKARFVLERLFKRLRRHIERATAPAGKSSAWSEYEENHPHGEAYPRVKSEVAEKLLSRVSPKALLDVGCNTGRYSVMAARTGAMVVALDRDETAVGRLHRRAVAEHLDILPLVVDFARPTPSTGWRNLEHASFLERAAGRFDTVIMLAVLHHLLAGEGIPLDEIIELAARLTTEHLIIEFVPREDPLFRACARGRTDLFSDFTRHVFEKACGTHFDLLHAEEVSALGRRVYLWRKRN